MSLFEDLQVVRRGMKLFEKDRKYHELTIEIGKMKKESGKIEMVKPLIQERILLQYNPSNPPEGLLSEEELKSRGLIVLDALSERKSYLLDLCEDSSDICEKFRDCVLRMFGEAKLSLSLNLNQNLVNNETNRCEPILAKNQSQDSRHSNLESFGSWLTELESNSNNKSKEDSGESKSSP